MVGQLKGAVVTLERHIAQQPVMRDAFAHAQNVSGWIAIICGHSLVEQAIKALLKKRGLPQAEQGGVGGHDLGELYGALPVDDRRSVEGDFMVLVRRYGHTPWNGAADYLSKVGSDYADWRYLLREKTDGGLSTTHPEALLEVARAIVRILECDRSSPEAPIATSAPADRRTTETTGDKPKLKGPREDKEMVSGLDKALDHLKKHAAENQVLLSSFDPQQPESVSAWMAITCGYSLLEQAVKSLLKLREDPRADKGGRAGHHIDQLYDALPERDRECVERGFGAYISLHDDVATSSTSEYLMRIGRDYNSWRYLLVERPSPSLAEVHLGALLEITGLVSEILENETFTDHGMHDVGRRLAFCIREDGINPSLFDLALERERKGLPQVPTTPLEAWRRQFPNILTAYAAFIRRGPMPGCEVVANVLKRTEKHLASLVPYPYGADFQAFLRRARNSEQPLIWDGEKKVFFEGG